MIWKHILIMVASHFLQAALAPRPPKPPTASMDDFDIPTPQEGRIIPRVFGRAKIKGMSVVYSGGLFRQSIRSKSSKK